MGHGSKRQNPHRRAASAALRRSARPARPESTLAVTGFTAAAALRLKKGDSFTLPTVFPVNRVSSDPQVDLQKFVVTADVSSAADGTATIPIYPPITLAQSPYQTVHQLAGRRRAAHHHQRHRGAACVGEASHSMRLRSSIGMAPLEVP